MFNVLFFVPRVYFGALEDSLLTKLLSDFNLIV